MKRKVSAVEARQRLGELLEGVFYRGDEVVIERAGKPMAVVIPADRYDALDRSRERLFALVERAQAANDQLSPDEATREAGAAVAEVRKAAKRRR